MAKGLGKLCRWRETGKKDHNYRFRTRKKIARDIGEYKKNNFIREGLEVDVKIDELRKHGKKICLLEIVK